jgi:hypothetical protein
MKRKIMGVYGKRQRGTVLAVALILLVVLTLAGLMAMQGVTVQERMTISQVQMQGAFLDSEQLVWDAAACIRAQYWNENTARFNSPLPATQTVVDTCGSPSGSPRARVVWNDVVNPNRYVVSANRAFAQTGAVSPVVLEVFTPGSLGGNDTFAPLPRLAPYVCFGPNCQFSAAAGRSSSSADGTNRMSPDWQESDFACGALGANRPSVNPEGGTVPGVVMPDGQLLGSFSTATEPPRRPPVPDLVGQPPAINSEAALISYTNQNITDHKAAIDTQIDQVLDELDGSNEGSRTLAAGQAGVFVAKAGQMITLSSGSNAAAFGLIILDGGTLELNGNQCFAGVVLFRNGGRVSSSSGTPAVLGTVMGYAPDDLTDIINPRLNGTPSFYYSSKAIQDAGDILAGELGPGFVFEIRSWRTPVELL